jgi:hypothetical protein
MLGCPRSTHISAGKGSGNMLGDSVLLQALVHIPLRVSPFDERPPGILDEA